MLRHPALLLLPFLLAGCPDPAVDDDDDDVVLGGAAGVTIDEVAIYQGVKRTLVVDGEPVESDVPLIAGRDALVRVFTTTDSSYDGSVTGRLTLGDAVLEVQGSLTDGASRDAALGSTLNFEVPGELVTDPLEWSVALLQEGAADNAAAYEPADGSHSVEVEGARNVLRIVIAPFSYEADGSGRLPDTSEAQVERIREEFLKLYPVTDVQIRVRDPEPWNGELGPDGSGWYGVGFALLGYRNSDDEDDDVYYYGMFNPTSNIASFCLGGCLLGVTLLNDNPPDVGSVSLRLALGVGYTEQAAGVAAHEIGHAHGRPHTPCGPAGNTPADIDPAYPYPDGNIGTWGYDIVQGVLRDPDEATDIMGYCDDQFVSDYTWRALFERGRNVNLPAASLQPRTWDFVAVDASGAHFAPPAQRRWGVAGEPVDVTVLVGGSPSTVRGSWTRWDHMDGGVLAFPRGPQAADRAEFVADGRFFQVTR